MELLNSDIWPSLWRPYRARFTTTCTGAELESGQHINIKIIYGSKTKGTIYLKGIYKRPNTYFSSSSTAMEVANATMFLLESLHIMSSSFNDSRPPLTLRMTLYISSILNYIEYV